MVACGALPLAMPMITLRLPFEDQETGLLHRVYEKDVELAELPEPGQRIPGLDTGYPLRVGRVGEKDGETTVWLSPISGFAQMTFGQQGWLDKRLSKAGWRRAYRPRP
jgi:hypothetical protein